MIRTHTEKKSESVSLSKHEYIRLKQQARAYRILVTKITELQMKDPLDEVVEDFKNTNLYTKNFLDDFESGLRRSSYSKKYAAKAS